MHGAKTFRPPALAARGGWFPAACSDVVKRVSGCLVLARYLSHDSNEMFPKFLFPQDSSFVCVRSHFW